MEDPQRDVPPMEPPKPPEHPIHDPLPEPPAPGDPLPLIKDPPLPDTPPVPPGEYARSRLDLRMRSRKLAARAMAEAGER